MATETDAQKLVRLGTKRVEKIINAINGLGNLGRLKPTAKQREIVFKTVQDALDTAEARWQGKEVAAAGFKMPA